MAEPSLTLDGTAEPSKTSSAIRGHIVYAADMLDMLALQRTNIYAQEPTAARTSTDHTGRVLIIASEQEPVRAYGGRCLRRVYDVEISADHERIRPLRDLARIVEGLTNFHASPLKTAITDMKDDEYLSEAERTYNLISLVSVGGPELVESETTRFAYEATLTLEQCPDPMTQEDS